MPEKAYPRENRKNLQRGHECGTNRDLAGHAFYQAGPGAGRHSREAGLPIGRKEVVAMPIDANNAAMARQQLNVQPGGHDEVARKRTEVMAAEEVAAEAEAFAARQMKLCRAEDEDALGVRLRVTAVV